MHVCDPRSHVWPKSPDFTTGSCVSCGVHEPVLLGKGSGQVSSLQFGVRHDLGRTLVRILLMRNLVLTLETSRPSDDHASPYDAHTIGFSWLHH